MTSVNNIISRTYFKLVLNLKSPLNLGNGASYYTDSDLLFRYAVDKNNHNTFSTRHKEYFIPGSSVAGAFRDYYLSFCPEKADKSDSNIYGYADGNNGRMSSVYFSDITFLNNDLIPTIRDFASLYQAGYSTESLLSAKQVNNKFDMEILEPGIKGNLYIECITREIDQISAKKELYKALLALNNGEIRLGSKKTRGFGVFEIEKIYERTFTKDNFENWLDFMNHPIDDDSRFDEEDTSKAGKDSHLFASWKESKNKNNIVCDTDKWIHVSIPLEQVGGISIRKYSATNGDPDYIQMSCNGKPVIPGSSWMGAIRSDARAILAELGIESKYIDDCLNVWFGCVIPKKKALSPKEITNSTSSFIESQSSKIIVDESILQNGNYLPMTRNQIDRFTGGTVGSALYTEKAFYNGTTTFSFHIKKYDKELEEKYPYQALIGLMKLIVQDIKQGYVTVGGQTSIGRGIFTSTDEKEDWYGIDLDKCNKEFYKFCKQYKEGK